MGWITSIANQKGGTGKSALARAFAVYAASKRGVQVILADLDKAQKTSLRWSERRAANDLKPAPLVVATSVMRLSDLAGTCDVLVVDAPGWTDAQTLQLATLSHLLVVPVAPKVDDLEPTVMLLRALQDEGIPAWRTHPAITKYNSDAQLAFGREYLEAAGFPALKGSLREKTAYSDAMDIGKTVCETGFPILNQEAHTLKKSIETALERVAEREPQAKARERAPAARETGRGER